MHSYPQSSATIIACLALCFCGCAGSPDRPAEITAMSGTGGLRVRRSLSSWKAIRERNMVMQSLDYSCGSAALATLMNFYFGDNVTEADILADILGALDEEEVNRRQSEGLSMLDLKQCAERRGYQAVGVRLQPALLPQLRGPVLVHLKRYDFEHFAVLRGAREGCVYLADPSWGNVSLSAAQFIARWTNVALVLGKENFGLPDAYPLAVKESELVDDNQLSPVRARYTLAPR